MKVDFVRDAMVGFTILVDGKHYHWCVPFHERVKCWERALVMLDADVEACASMASRKKYEEYYWAYTFENHRNDGVLGTVYEYYVANVVDHLRVMNGNLELVRSRYLPSNLYWWLRQSGSYKISNALKLIIGRDILKLDSILKWLKRCVQLSRIYLSSFMTAGRIKNHTYPVLLASNKKGIIARYAHLIQDFAEVNMALYNATVTESIHSSKYGVFRMLQLVSLRLVWQSISFAVQMKKQFQIIKAAPSIFSQHVIRQNILELSILRLRQLILSAAWERFGVKEVFYSGSIADPVQKLSVLGANKSGVLMTVVACRPCLSKFRSEDRILSSESSTMNGAHLPRRIIVKDKFSATTLAEQGYPGNQIEIRGRRADDECTLTEFRDCVVLLLTQYHINTLLIQLLSKSDLSGFSKLAIRSHPNRRSIHALDSPQLAMIHKLGIEVIDITDSQWDKLKFINSLAIGVNTSAMVEAAGCGCGLVWAPFLSDFALQFFPLMSKIGVMAHDQDEFSRLLGSMGTDKVVRQKYVDQCAKVYQEEIR